MNENEDEEQETPDEDEGFVEMVASLDDENIVSSLKLDAKVQLMNAQHY